MGVESFVNQVRNGTFQSAFTEYIDRAGKVFTPIKLSVDQQMKHRIFVCLFGWVCLAVVVVGFAGLLLWSYGCWWLMHYIITQVACLLWFYGCCG